MVANERCAQGFASSSFFSSGFTRPFTRSSLWSLMLASSMPATILGRADPTQHRRSNRQETVQLRFQSQSSYQMLLSVTHCEYDPPPQIRCLKTEPHRL